MINSSNIHIKLADKFSYRHNNCQLDDEDMDFIAITITNDKDNSDCTLYFQKEQYNKLAELRDTIDTCVAYLQEKGYFN